MKTIKWLFCVIVLSILFIFAGYHFRHPPQVSISSINRNSQHQRRRPRTPNVEPNNSPENIVIVYNRIPKTGSTSFMNATYKLALVNRFSVALVKLSTKKYLWHFNDQYFFAKNITLWQARKPAVFHGHFPFLGFIPLGFPQPLYINIVRDPLERFVSHYYFLRFGDTYSPNKIRKRHGDPTTLDECVLQRKYDCNITRMWLQIPYFCGSDPICWKPGNKFALHRAKENVLNYYFLVGTTDRIGNFVEILDKALPRIFKGAGKMFNFGRGIHLRKTKKKIPVKEETITQIKASSIWKMEQDFYVFVKERFDAFYANFQVSRRVDYLKLVKSRVG